MKTTVPSDTPLAPPADYVIRLPAAAPSSGLIIWMIGLVACLTAFALYLTLHGADKPGAPNVATPSAAPAQPHGQVPDVQAMVERLAARLQKEPGNGPGWQMLARSYAALGRFADAAVAYDKAAALLPPDADLLADHADVLAMAQSGSFGGEPARLIKQALEINPRHPKALALAGTEAMKRDDSQEALRYWNKALELVPADSELAVSIRSGIAKAESRRKGTTGN